MRDYKSVQDHLYNTVHRNIKPLKAIAEELDTTPNRLTKWVLTDREEYPDEDKSNGNFPLRKLVRLIKFTNDYSVLDAIEQCVGRVGVPLPSPVGASMADICRLTMQMVKNFGHLVGDMETSISDDKLTQAECDHIGEECYKTIQTILVLRAACKGKDE